MFPTCIVDAVETEIGFATARVIERTGRDVEVPDGATCCGQPAWNAGHAGAAAQVARTSLRALADTDAAIVVPSGSCTTMIRVFWAELFELHGDETDRRQARDVAARTYELSEYLSVHGAPSGRLSDSTAVVYHRSCHMLRELGISSEPEAILDGYGAERRETASEDRCCGFGGLFSIKLPETSVAMADEVLDAIVPTGATRVVGCDASCLLHLRGRARKRGLDLEFRHFAEIVDRATGDGS